MRKPRTGGGFWVALVAAYLLVFQGILANAIAGDFGASSLLASIEKVTCLGQGGEGSDRPSDTGQSHRHVPNCCSYGCPMLGASSALPLPDDVGVAWLPEREPSAVPPLRPARPAEPEARPQSPRAPPLI